MVNAVGENASASPVFEVGRNLAIEDIQAAVGFLPST